VKRSQRLRRRLELARAHRESSPIRTELDRFVPIGHADFQRALLEAPAPRVDLPDVSRETVWNGLGSAEMVT